MTTPVWDPRRNRSIISAAQASMHAGANSHTVAASSVALKEGKDHMWTSQLPVAQQLHPAQTEHLDPFQSSSTR